MIKDIVKKDCEIIIYTEKSNVSVDFLAPVMEFILFKDSALVMTNTNKKTYGDRNIFRVSAEGKVVWQIEQPVKFRGIDANRSVCFTGLRVDEAGKIKAGCLNDFTYEVDFETGKFLNKVHDK